MTVQSLWYNVRSVIKREIKGVTGYSLHDYRGKYVLFYLQIVRVPSTISDLSPNRESTWIRHVRNIFTWNCGHTFPDAKVWKVWVSKGSVIVSQGYRLSGQVIPITCYRETKPGSSLQTSLCHKYFNLFLSYNFRSNGVGNDRVIKTPVRGIDMYEVPSKHRLTTVFLVKRCM